MTIEVFYVTNRTCAAPGHCPQKTATIANLEKLGLIRLRRRLILLAGGLGVVVMACAAPLDGKPPVSVTERSLSRLAK